jgi:DNA-binding MarR family transcriptional regulator
MADLAHDLLILINDLARGIRTEADRRARCHGMTRAQWMILARLERTPGMSQRELAELIEVEPITVGRLVDRLEARRLVERRPDPDDRRIWRLHLRPEADAVLQEIATQRAEILDIVTSGLSPPAVEQTKQSLHRMKRNMATARKAAVQPDRKDPPRVSSG